LCCVFVRSAAANVQRKFTFEGTENSSAQSNAIMSPVSQQKAAISASALMNMDVQSEPLTAAALGTFSRFLFSDLKSL
jgi:hypothetical protein